MSEAKHTPGRLTLVDIYADHEIRTKDGLLLAVLDARQRANAKRLIACWNALEGIADPENMVPRLLRANEQVLELEPLRIQRDELLAALALLVDTYGQNTPMWDQARAAIAEATGSAA